MLIGSFEEDEVVNDVRSDESDRILVPDHTAIDSMTSSFSVTHSLYRGVNMRFSQMT